MRAAIPMRLPSYKYHWDGGLWYNQGSYGVCVGASWSHWIEDGPVTQPGTVNPIDLYREIVKVDEWPQNDNGDLYFGSSVRAGAKVLQTKGLISEYRWAWDAKTVADTVLGKGPVVVGSNWYSGMFKTDSDGFVNLTGSREGGHAWIINGYNANRRVFRAKNSWGRNWGVNGRFLLRFDDLERLIDEDGEACLAVEVKG